jgi:hypothetical protein
MTALAGKVDDMLTGWARDHRAQTERRYRDPDQPLAVYEALDRVLLIEFARAGAQTKGALTGSRAATTYGIDAPVTADWMDAARRRGLITRVRDDTDVHGNPLVVAEWELTARGWERCQHVEPYAEARRLTKWLLAAVALLGTVLGVLKALGVERLPSDTVLVLLVVLAFALMTILGLLVPSPRLTQEIVDHAVAEIERRIDAEPPAACRPAVRASDHGA